LVVGHAATIAAITASGDWVNDRTMVMPQGNLLYTGVTRGQKLVVLVGQNKARRDRADSRRKARGSETQCC
jgi:hypothetical protein